LSRLSEADLEFIVARNMGTLGQQFRHLARVRAQYIEALSTKKIGPVKLKIDPSVSRSKKRLVALHRSLDTKLLSALEKLSEDEVDRVRINWTYWGLRPMNVVQHLQALNEHEVLHNGQLIVYMRALGKKFPKAWEAWGL
jgi:uncharacterized damage-inducible protein DinB